MKKLRAVVHGRVWRVGVLIWLLSPLVVIQPGWADAAAEDMRIGGDRGSSVFIGYLHDPLWEQRDAYDAGHRLMIPLHWAVNAKDEDFLLAFVEHFLQFHRQVNQDGWDIGTIRELQYLSLISRYLAMGAPAAKADERKKLFEFTLERFNDYFRKREAWQWGREAFSGGVEGRVAWKLETNEVGLSYYNAVIDQDLYVLGIGADLLAASRRNDRSCLACEDAVELFVTVLEKRLAPDSRWGFQEGFWSDHPTYSHAGYLSKPGREATAIKVHDIQSDSSHGHRWPLWLAQLDNAINVERYIKRLRAHFVKTVVSQETGVGVPALHNFMSGHNGYYRWNYETHNEGEGYGPYELSGTFGLGWWALLGGEEISELYRKLLDAYPLNEAQLDLYTGKSQRERHSLVSDEHENGLRESIAAMAKDVAVSR